MTKTVALYLRVSSGGQSVDMQRRDLLEAIQGKGWRVVGEYVDDRISGTKGRDQRPALDRLCKAIVRHEFDVVAAWSVDRIARSMQHLVAFVGEIEAAGVDLYLHRDAFDTTTPMGKAMFVVRGVFAELERTIIVERVRAGVAKAKMQGTRSGKAIGRPKATEEQMARIRAALAGGDGIRKVARSLACGNGLVGRIAQEMRAA